jgi:hypothetical protein
MPLPSNAIGFHFDIHAGPEAGRLQHGPTADELVSMLDGLEIDLVQADCKGHPGFTTWPSRIPEASVPAHLDTDILQVWREATHRLGLPLHGHYSGIVDAAAAERHPDWCVQVPEGTQSPGPRATALGPPPATSMCPRSPYLDELMIPQLREAIDRYALDGFWIDGDLWAVYPCHCPRCADAYRTESGRDTPPLTDTDPDWPGWIDFTRRSFETFVRRYTDAVHAHAPGTRICSNWLQSFSHPGEPAVPTDWISGDNTWVWALDACRCESRFISTRGKPWDIMLWTFFRSSRSFDPALTWEQKPPEMLMREAAVPLALGGGLQLYFLHDKATGHGTPIPWHIEQAAPVFDFAKERQNLCADTETIPQIAVLHSEHHVRSRPGVNLMWDVDTAPVQGAVWSLLENQYGVDILDEWALLPRLHDFPLLVAPEQDKMSDRMRDALLEYVEAGGNLLLTGAGACQTFGPEPLGIQDTAPLGMDTCLIPVDHGALRVTAADWLRLTPGTATPFAPLLSSPDRREPTLECPAAILQPYGNGNILYVPGDIFCFYARSRQSTLRRWVGQLIDTFQIPWDIRVTAPPGIDVTLRRKGGSAFVHVVNRANGLPGGPDDGTELAIPPVGPVRVRMRLPRPPHQVQLHFEPHSLTWTHQADTLEVDLDRVSIHAAIEIA